jgi:hypothetical protein
VDDALCFLVYGKAVEKRPGGFPAMIGRAGFSLETWLPDDKKIQ